VVEEEHDVADGDWDNPWSKGWMVGLIVARDERLQIS
jgi:hypothetical protein